ncbi:MAG: FAD-dependent oxidoreductase [Bacteroidales bacterium]|nr:FAD-dependent oxidoreductase [Bacteroidales bacterium]
MEKSCFDVIIVGGGIAGMQTAIYLSEMNFKVALFEKQNRLGGKLLEYDRLFPSFEKAEDILNELNQRIQSLPIELFVGENVEKVEKKDGFFFIQTESGRIDSQALVLAFGFEFFDATLKEEYGYRVVENVYTSVDIEKMIKNPLSLQQRFSSKPQAFGFVHCVGSRDEKVKNNYCSKVCCITAIKQAIELKEIFPTSEIFCFYMDLRLHELMFETIYKRAQMDYGIHFVRGKISEVAQGRDGKVVLKVEDTLLSMPLSMELDALVLMIGMEGKRPTLSNDLSFNLFDFVDVGDLYIYKNWKKGVFCVGACKGPRSVQETLQDASQTAMEVYRYLKVK